jgi:hypothetical protein
MIQAPSGETPAQDLSPDHVARFAKQRPSFLPGLRYDTVEPGIAALAPHLLPAA